MLSLLDWSLILAYLAFAWAAPSAFVFSLMFPVGAPLPGAWTQAAWLALLLGFSARMAWGIDRRCRYGVPFV